MVAIDRRTLLIGTGAALMNQSAPAGSEWQTASPADAGFAPDMDARLDKLIADKRVWGQHAIVMARKGALVFERYFEGEDEIWGRPVGRVAFGPDTVHDLRSVTKSVLGLIYGIALAQGKVPAPEQPLLEHFPEYAPLMTDPRAKRLTVAHALTMSLGLEWNEDIPYQDPRNSEIQMELAPDRYRFIFTRPFMADPGARWIYGAAATELIGALIVKGTGQSLPDFARANLFEPLGTGATAWTNGLNGKPAPSSGLRMTPRDLARIGQLILNRGRWEGRQVIKAEWLDASFRAHITADEFRRYGYFWYLGNLLSRKGQWIGGFGYGGQRLFVLPDFDIVVAITAGNYTDRDQGIPPIRVIGEFMLPSLQ